MIGDERDNLRVNAWIRGGKKNGFFVRPRLFMPYYEEIKVTMRVSECRGACLLWELYRLTLILNYFYLFSVLGGRSDGPGS